MNVKSICVSALMAALAASGAMAQEADSDTWMRSGSGKTRAEVSREAVLARANGDLDPVREYDIVPRDFAPMLSRAEVIAEAILYRDSGLAELERGEAGFDAFSERHRRAYARYVAMRASPFFAELVESIAKRRRG